MLVTSPGLAANAPSSTITVTVKVLTPAGPVLLSSPVNTSSATLSGAQPQAEVRALRNCRLRRRPISPCGHP